MDLHAAGFRRGVVAAPHAGAVAAGRDILAEGGNALEAMVAMAASIAAVYPHMNHIGGDGFWLIREPNGRVRALMGAGPAGANATPRLYREHGYDEIPARGPLAALTVPGAVGGWILALDAAQAYGGKLPLTLLLAPAIRSAAEGVAVSRSQARLTREKLAELKHVPGFADVFLSFSPPPERGRSTAQQSGGGRLFDPSPDRLQRSDPPLSGEGKKGLGNPPEVGALQRQPALAATLEQLAHAGLEDFYRGDVGREIAADLERIGSPVTRPDLERYRAVVAEPLSLRLEVGTAYNTPLPTQGLASLLILGIVERLRIAEADSFDYVHGTVEATKRAFRVRDRVITDPARSIESLDRFLAPAFLDAQAARIDRSKAAHWPAPHSQGDTIWMGAADSSGLVVSYIQSLYWEFGSGVVLPRSGVLMQNRGASLSLDGAALNALAPGRLPFHTLNPALAVLRDGRIIAYGTMGGDGQPQSQAALFTRYVSFRQPLDQAIDRPRWVLGRTWGSTVTNLRLESRFDGNLIDRLVSAGHDVEVLANGYSDTMGHSGAVVLHPDGSLEGGHDPRADGGADGV